jgi:hypothetical protein
MPLEVDTDRVTAVLLADGWHKVHTFLIDALHYVWTPDTTPRRQLRITTVTGEPDDEAAADEENREQRYAYGFSFTEERDGDWISGPLSSILAVRAP